MKYLLVVLCLLANVVLAKPNITVPSSIDLNYLKSMAKDHNFTINSAKFETLAYEMDEKSARSKFYPKLGIQGSWTQNTSKGLDNTEELKAVYGEYNVFNGFKDQSALVKKSLAKKASKSRLRATELEEILKVEKLYYGYLYLKKQHEITNEAIKRNNRHLRLIKKRLNSGLVTRTDLIEFKLKNSELQAELSFLDLSKKEMKNKLLHRAGINPLLVKEIKGEIPHFFIDKKLDELGSTFKKNNEHLKQMNFLIEDSMMDLKVSRSSWWPKVDLEAKYGHLDQQDTGFNNSDISTSIGVVAKWELFSGNATNYQSDRSKYQKLRNEYHLKQEVLEGSSMLEASHQMMIALQNRIKLSEANEKMAMELYKRTLKEYQRGIKDSGALSSAGDQLTAIKTKIYELKNSFINSKLNLEKLLGKELKLKTLTH